MRSKSIPAVLALLVLAGEGLGADWPQWRGANRDGKSADTGLLEEWPEGGPPLAWKAEGLGGGDSAPSVAGGRIFGMSNRGGEEVVWILSEEDGSEIGVTPIGPAFRQRPGQAREGPGCTPTVDGEFLYVEGLAGTVACLRIKDGSIVWQRSLTEDFGGRIPMWSYRESPLIDGDRLICTPGSEEAPVVALNKLTGETIWVCRRPEEPAGEAGADPAAIPGTTEPGLFSSEHWGMRAFSCRIPNGKYVAKLYFAEMYEGITGPGQRVFSFAVQGREFPDFDIWVKAGGPRRAYVETVPVEVTDGEFRVVFTRQVENPAISAIEIVPEAEADAPGTTVRVKAGLAEPFTDSRGRVWQPDSGFEGGMTNRFTGGGGGAPGGSGALGAAYASPIAIDVGGRRQVVQLTARALIGVAMSDGTLLWRYDRPANRMGINCSTPLHEDNMVFASSAYGAGGGLVKITMGPDNSATAEEAYATADMQSHHGGMILHDGCIYGASGGNEGGALACLDFRTGTVLWDRRREDGRAAKGSLAMADGKFYYRMERTGTMVLIEPNRERYIERGRFDQPDRTRLPAWAHPVVANGKLYVRDQDMLLCYDIKAD